MDATTPRQLLTEAGTNSLMRRLWREHLHRHRGRLLLVLLLTAIMATLTGLYPVVIDRAFSMFAAKDRRILYQVPALVVVITAAKAAATYGQTVLTQSLVLRTIRELQVRMFAHLTEADLARVERESPAQTRRPLHHRRCHHPRGAHPRDRRRGQRDHRARPDRLDAVAGLGAEPDRRLPVSARRPADPAASASASAVPRAACRSAWARRRVC